MIITELFYEVSENILRRFMFAMLLHSMSLNVIYWSVSKWRSITFIIHLSRSQMITAELNVKNLKFIISIYYLVYYESHVRINRDGSVQPFLIIAGFPVLRFHDFTSKRWLDLASSTLDIGFSFVNSVRNLLGLLICNGNTL